MYTHNSFFTQKTVPCNKKLPVPVHLMGYPQMMQESFALLKAAGASHFALFGGAVRDSDYAARHHLPCCIKDYDFRVWLPEEWYETHKKELINQLSLLTHCSITEVPSMGTKKPRYCFIYKGVEFDLSIRPIPEIYRNKRISIEAVALDRARDGDIGLSSVAIDPSVNAWAMPEYLLDQTNKTLTVYASEDKERIESYVNRMHAKYPDHQVNSLEPLFSSNLLSD